MTAEQVRDWPTLDDILDGAEAAWTAWRLEHPEPAPGSDEVGDAQYEISTSCPPADEMTLLMLASDRRVREHQIEMAPDSVPGAIREAIEYIVEHRLEAIEAARASPQPPALHEIFAKAEMAWTRWVQEHPEVDLKSSSDAHSSAKFEAVREIAGAVTPESADALKRLATDAFVWEHDGSGAGYDIQGKTIEQAVAIKIADLVADHICRVGWGDEISTVGAPAKRRPALPRDRSGGTGRRRWPPGGGSPPAR